MKKILFRLPLVLIFLNIALSAWSVLNKDIYYYTDIGRDFLIFDEIATKKLVLIGPRADFQGLFHGILWHYLNMPAYLIGKGNPVVVGWFWILLTIGFLITAYIAIKNLFDKKSATIAVILLSGAMVPISQGFFHGNGAMLVLPAFFYLFVRYTQTANPWYLVGHLLVSGMLIQFEIALGVPLALLSGIANLFLIIRKRKLIHLLAFIALGLFLTSFILVDIRHDFLQLRSFISYIQGNRNGIPIPFTTSLKDRLFNLSTHGINILRFPLHKYNIVVVVLMIYSFIRVFKKKDKKKPIYVSFLYFYLGYYALNLFHGGFVIMFWWLPMSVLPLLAFSTLHRYLPRLIYFGLLSALVLTTGYQNVTFIRKINSEFGNAFTSWRFHLDNAKKVFADAPKEFGYFIYAPDIFGYQDKYAMLYAQKLSGKKAFKFIKKPVTYILIEPPPGFRPDLYPNLWIENDVAIRSKPAKTIPLPGGYKINKYVLSPADLNAYAKITPSHWLFFR